MNTRPAGVPLRPDFSSFDRQSRDASMRSLVRACIASAIGADSNFEYAGDIVKARWPSDRNALALVERSAVSPATMSSVGDLSTTVYGFITALRPMSAGADLLSRCLQLSFGDNSVIVLSEVTAPAAGFIGEAAPIPVAAAVIADQSFTPKKFSSLVVLTSEMLKGSNAEEIVGLALKEATAGALDAALFSATAADTTRPAGLFNGIGATGANGGSGEAAMSADLANLVSAVSSVGGAGVCIVAAPPQAVALGLRAPQLPWPVLVSTALADGTVLALATNCLVSAFAPTPTIEASKESVVHMETSPTAISATGVPNTVAAPVRSLFQTDCVSLKLRLNCAWRLRTAAGLAWT